MKFAIAVHGTRGDVEPCAAVGVELHRRGHEVRIAVPPDLVPLVESAGLPNATGYGIESQELVNTDVFRDWWKPRNPLLAFREAQHYASNGWAEMGAALNTMAAGTDLVLTGTTYQEVAANVAEKQELPLAALHYFPARPNGKITPVRLPGPVVRSAMRVGEWAYWRLVKPADDQQRRELGLPAARVRSAQRIVQDGTLEIQAYDEALFPGLNDEWQSSRPFIGSITLELETPADDDVAAWIASGTPPLYFGFGSTPIDSPSELLAMIESVCAELGERALVGMRASDSDNLSPGPGIKVVNSVNYAAVFPACRAVVHHGGAGTLAAALRAGVPSVALWSVADQPLWASRAAHLGVGTARRFTHTTRTSLLADLRTVLQPEYAARTRELASRMIQPTHGVARAADLLEDAARKGRLPRANQPSRGRHQADLRQ